ncbi:interferon lambda receptor 1 isoform X2 [Xenopus laevis]|uniref:Interferon lambda receptor 1 isoform X2 n=1 Tax=Xenopus laevis TaxID=8355 RepID=A0A8J0U6Y3_XENLA|nr:interferon lambda receptor 1 isoform X2 [Xenopus laevis]
MSVCFTWAFVISQCFVLQIAGILYPPLNVTTISRNFRLLLTWTPAPGNPPNVSYQVSYRNINSKWSRKNQACRNITVRECDLTCLLDYTHNYIVGVRTISGSSKSQWEEVKDISYIFTVDPEVPTLQVKLVDKSIYINATVKTPHCIKDVYNLKYNIIAWLNDGPKQMIFGEVKMNSVINLSTIGLNGNYCVAASTVFKLEQTKISQLSNSSCHFVRDKEHNSDQNWSFAVLIFFSILICGIFVYYIKYRHPVKAQTPIALDFSKFRTGRELCTLESLEMIPKQCDKITAVEIKQKCSSPSSLFVSGKNMNIDDYELRQLGYTEKHPVLRESGEDGSKLMDLSSDKCSTSGFSCEESESSSGPNISNLLTLHDKQKANLDHIQDKDEDKIRKPDPNELLLSTAKSDFPNISSLGSKSSCQLNQILSVRLETLKIEGKSSQVEDSDGESSDQFSSESEDSEVAESETTDQLCTHSNLQKLRCTGYESRGYMSR